MSRQRLKLLGTPQVTWAADAPPRFRSPRAQALLAYLVVERRPVARDKLALLLWPDEPLAQGRAALRRELYNLGAVLPDCWLVDRKTAYFAPTDDTEVDLDRVQKLEEGDRWAEAAALIGGEFLEGVELPDNLEYETWLLGERERWQQRAERILRQAVNERVQAGDDDGALRIARRLLQLLPWHEEMHRQVMVLLAQRGQRSAALRQYEQCRVVLQAELGVDVSVETQALYERIRDSVTFVLHNIPAPIAPLVGREQELAQLGRWLQDGAVRLITIAGAGGMGKTRLALALAQDALDRPATAFRDGIYFVSLAALEEPARIVFEIADTLKFPLQPGDRRTPGEQLLDHLRSRQMLLILDNFEQLLPAGDWVTIILQTAPGIQIVVTSRERLRVQGEQVLPLSGLIFADRPAAAGGAQSEAARLFVTAAGRVQPAFRVDPEHERQLQHICRLVEGMPLALELAAGWADTLSLPAIAGEIERSLGFLATDRRGIEARHRSMQAVFDSSWQRLSPQEQKVLARLSVFRGGFSRAAAAAVSGADLQILSRLINRSLVHYDAEGERYELHELLRQFSADKLAQEPQHHRDTHQKHCDYFCGWLREQEEAIRIVRRPLHETAIVADVPNAKRAVEWALEHEAAASLAKAIATWGMLLMRRLGRYHDGQDSFNRIARLAEQKVEQAPADAQWRYVLAVGLMWRAEFTHILAGEEPTLQEWLGRSIELWAEPGTAEPAVGWELSWTYEVLGDTFVGPEADANYQLALDAARAAGDSWAVANALNARSRFFGFTPEKLATAHANQLAAYRLRQELNDLAGLGWSSQDLAWLSLFQREYDAAERYATESLQLRERLGSTNGLARILEVSGWVAMARGDFEAAAERYERALALWEELRFAYAAFDDYYALALAHLHMGRWQKARAVTDACCDVAEKQDNFLGRAYGSLLHGMLLLVEGQTNDAAATLREAAHLLETDKLEQGAVQARLFSALAQLDRDLAAAREALDQLEVVFDEQVTYTLAKARLHAVKAAFCGAEGDDAAAQELWREACQEPMIGNSRWYAITVGRYLQR